VRARRRWRTPSHRPASGVPAVDVPAIETRPDVIGWLDSEHPDSNEMRWYQALTGDTQEMGERHQPWKRATTTMQKATTATNKRKSGAKEGKEGDSPSRLIDARIKELRDWRGETLARVRTLIKQADPEVVEEWKWRGVPVWEHAGIICTGETYKNVVKMTFAKGASLKDPSGLFNSSLEGNTRRAIDLHAGDKIDEKALKALIRAAVALNTSGQATARSVRSQKKPKSG
jgi:hypothetical protein